MQLNIQGKQMNVGDALKSHVNTKMEAINSKYFGRAIDVEVTISPEAGAFYKTHITMNSGKNIHVVGTAIEPDPYVSFDQAAERVAKQLRRYKNRLRDHHERPERTPEAEIVKARDYVLAVQDEAANDHENEDERMLNGHDPVVIADMTRGVETLSVSDAVMRLDLSDAPALVFYNAKSESINVVYRRADGNIGWVDPQN